MSFLTAEWRKLAMANYAIDPDVLKKYIPAKTELDVWNGSCYVSLVGFMFLNTRLLGIKVPFHTHFEEVNLRFYVKYYDGKAWKRGVVFIKEIVPKHAITFVANTLYKEHYQTLPMKHDWSETPDQHIIEYNWRRKDQWQKFKVETDKDLIPIETGSEAEFITEHYWGYSRHSDLTTIEYEVTHPKWQQYRVQKHEIDVDFGLIYGQDFAFINNLKPKSVFLAEGSAITVENKKVL
ncbi:MAG: DUF2071 domain-containing protein [Saprospiraceae bacterium]|nr:DUF2071 domain-containing protein [Saprospiraceae bacterium]